MNPFGLGKVKITAGIIGIHLVAAALLYFVFLPLAAPADQELVPATRDSLLFTYVAAGFLVGCVLSIVAVFVCGFILPRRTDLAEALASLRLPAVLLDENNRYEMVNEEAEKLLSIHRENDLGKQADQKIQAALKVSGGTAFNPRASVELRSRKYLVLDNPLPVSDPNMPGRKRVVMFQDATNLFQVRDAVREVNKIMSLLNANTAKIANSTATFSQGAAQQAGSLSAITTSLDEFSKKIQGNTESATKNRQLAAQAREAAERSGGEIAHALTAMMDVQDAGVRIARIVKLIDDIAFQTNLLALNAAVEAARAGRQGKGFAVVAGEVRSLAGRSAKAAKDTATMVEDVTERIGNASMYISKLEEMLRNIVQDSIRMADSSSSASATSTEQAAAILQVNHELGQISSVTSNTTASAEQTATAVEVLARQVNMLKERLDGLGDSLALDADSGELSRINLVDEPAMYSRTHTHSYLESPSSDPARPYTRQAEGERNMYNATPPGFFHSDGGNDENPVAFSERSNIGLDAPLEYKTSPEGDKVVRPTQNIQLDDAEFGRY